MMHDEDIKKEIPVIKRSSEEVRSYQEGFKAGVEMCLQAIRENYDKYQEMIKPLLELAEKGRRTERYGENTRKK